MQPNPEFVLRGCDSPVTSLYLSETKSSEYRKLVSGDQNGFVSVWNLDTRRVVHKIQAHEQSVLKVAIVDDVLISHGRDGKLCVWDATLQQKEYLRYVDVASYGFCGFALALSNCVNYLLVPGRESAEVDVYHLTSLAPAFTLSGAASNDSLGMVMGIQTFCNRSDQLRTLIVYESGSVVLWHLPQTKVLSRLKLCDAVATCVDYHVDINKGVCGTVTDKLYIFNIDESEQLTIIREITITNEGLNCVRIRPDGKLFLTGGWDSRVRLFSCKKLAPLAVLTHHTQSVQALAVSSDNVFSVGSKDSLISVWQLY